MAKKKSVQAPKPLKQVQRQTQGGGAASTAAEPSQSAKFSEWLGPSFLVPVFSSTIVLGYLLYARGVATLQGNELSHHQALFTAVNAATLTGFQQARNPDDYTVAGKVLTFFLMLSGMLFSFICGGAAVVRIARLRFGIREIVAWSIGSICLAAIGGGLALQASGGRGAASRGFGESVFQAVSAFGNCGLTLGALGDSSSPACVLVLLPLSVLGGLGLPVLMNGVDRLRGRGMLSQHSRTVLVWTAGSYVVITVLLFLLRWPGVNASFSFWHSALVEASQQAINARSAGFEFQFASRLPQAITFALVLVMIVGASPGGSAGGLKVTTIAELTRGTREALTGRAGGQLAEQPRGRPFGAAIVWLLVYLLMLCGSTVALLMTEPEIHLDRTLFLAASALGNVGLSHNPIDVSTAGLYVLSATMVLGRVAPVMMLWYVVDTVPGANVAIG